MQYDAEHMGRLSDCLVIKSNATRCASAMQLDDQVNAITQVAGVAVPKTPINKNNGSVFWKDHVGLPR